jgi:hypothetical protein
MFSAQPDLTISPGRMRLTLYGIDTAALDITAWGDILEGLRPGFEDGRLTPPDTDSHSR